jgi:hypothetical protein
VSNFFQVVVDRDASEPQAVFLADRVLEWLKVEQIVEATPTACVLGLDDMGYAPGCQMENWLDPRDDGQDTRRMKVNGLELITKKTVFWSVSTDYKAECPHGHAHTPPEGWLALAGEWFDATGPALMECPTCHDSFSVTEWTFGHSFAFGYLGFQFWSWPPYLSQRLVDEVARLVAPHRVALVYSKL